MKKLKLFQTSKNRNFIKFRKKLIKNLSAIIISNDDNKL